MPAIEEFAFEQRPKEDEILGLFRAYLTDRRLYAPEGRHPISLKVVENWQVFLTPCGGDELENSFTETEFCRLRFFIRSRSCTRLIPSSSNIDVS